MPPFRPQGSATGQRRQAVLDAALDTFVEVGESGTFIQEVCKRAEVSVGTLYHHFGSKDQLIAILHHTLLNDYQAGARPILEVDPPAEQGIRQTVAYHVDWLVGHPREAAFLLQQPFAGYRSDRVPAELVQEGEEFLAVVHGWLDRRMEEGTLRKLPFDIVVASLIGPVHLWARSELFLGAARAAAKARSATSMLSDGAWQALRP